MSSPGEKNPLFFRVAMAWSCLIYPLFFRATVAYRDKLLRWLPEDDARLLSMMEECRPWPKIESCFPERTESALRQRVSTLRKHERGMRTAERAGVTAASANPEGKT
ncbi:hypothetical protein BDDG_01927 [Blastomyces dermatitidis ATCC 18188]|uniref:Myb-like domain-containing protein n=1 Tax=Ajellomyces dermatitidis (strain ATCC 18188 / CBS 674.68) TaxID=653446 RepID=F2T6X7_AJEDA|nr:hypothetical protein BDDG_01927 [Blastomyces dermatitidis ATCC 18188]